jgi:DNA polymerase III subunit delta'
VSEDEAITSPHPRETSELFGHDEAEAALLNAFRSGRMPHAWLIGGPRGIGKATLAYRVARFILAHGDAANPAVQHATSLAVDPALPAARQVAMQTHAQLLTLERVASDSGALRSVITVDQVRLTVPFFGSTAAASGWRICVVDTVDELNWPEAPNALLKVLEEPPAKALFLLVSHAPARVLPTIQSRCRKLLLRALDTDDVARAAAAATAAEAGAPSRRAAAEASEGSVARAIMLMGGDALDLHQRIADVLQTLPATDPAALHALGDRLAGNDRTAFTLLVDAIDRWLTERLRSGNADLARLAKVSEVWEKLNRAARDTESFNLDKRPFVFTAFGLLAEVAR